MEKVGEPSGTRTHNNIRAIYEVYKLLLLIVGFVNFRSRLRRAEKSKFISLRTAHKASLPQRQVYFSASWLCGEPPSRHCPVQITVPSPVRVSRSCAEDHSHEGSDFSPNAERGEEWISIKVLSYVGSLFLTKFELQVKNLNKNMRGFHK